MCQLCKAKCHVVGSKHANNRGLIVHEDEQHNVVTVAVLTLDGHACIVKEVLDEQYRELAYSEAEQIDARIKEEAAMKREMLASMPPGLRALIGA